MKLSALVLVAILTPSLAIGYYDAINSYNKSEYWNMPALFAYDSYEQCLQNKPGGVFCVTKVVIKPDGRSHIWQLIEKYSRHTFQYNHDVLTRGVCLEECEKRLAHWTSEQRQQFYQPKFNISKRYILSDWILPNASHIRKEYGTVINMCQNYIHRTQYNLTVYSEIEICFTNSKPYRSLEPSDILFAAYLAVLVMLAIASQLYDSYLAQHSDDINTHYSKSLPDRRATLLTAFSIRRNWARLTRPPLYDAPYQRDFQYLDAVRSFFMTTILLSHVFLGLSQYTTQNPIAMEMISAHPIGQMFFSMIPFQVDLFLCISGLLLTVQFLHFTEHKKFRWDYLGNGVIKRYLRSFPVYASVIFFSATWFDQLEFAPAAYKVMRLTRTMCRKKWWHNLLYINNYYEPEEPCVAITWYLAADFQLFVVGLTALIVIWKKPNLVKWFGVVAIVAGFLLPMLNTYLHGLEPFMPLAVKGSEYQLWYEEHVLKSYSATETHCASYLFGMIVGLLYQKIKNKDITLPPYLLRAIFCLSLITTLSFVLMAPFTYVQTFERQSLKLAALSGLHKLAYATLFSVMFLHYGLNGSARKSEVPVVFQVMPRLGLGFYVIQWTVLSTLIGNLPEDSRTHWQTIISVFCSGFMISYILALALYLLVEAPFQICVRYLLETDKSDAKPVDVAHEALRKPKRSHPRKGSPPSPKAKQRSTIYRVE